MTFYVVPLCSVRDHSVATLVHVSGQALGHGGQVDQALPECGSRAGLAATMRPHGEDRIAHPPEEKGLGGAELGVTPSDSVDVGSRGGWHELKPRNGLGRPSAVSPRRAPTLPHARRVLTKMDDTARRVHTGKPG